MSQSDRIADIEARTRDLLRRDPTTAAYLAESERRDAALPSAPVITLMSPGEKPTEPGWYAADTHEGKRLIVYISVDDDPVDPDEPMVGYNGNDCDFPLAGQKLKLVAQIYPERIEGRAEG